MTREDESLHMALLPRHSWIVGQISCWLMLSNVSGLTHRGFEATDVAQGLEFQDLWAADRPPVVVHYFTIWEAQFLSWLDRGKTSHQPRSHAFGRRLRFMP